MTKDAGGTCGIHFVEASMARLNRDVSSGQDDEETSGEASIRNLIAKHWISLRGFAITKRKRFREKRKVQYTACRRMKRWL